jgi:hypothetical protein
MAPTLYASQKRQRQQRANGAEAPLVGSPRVLTTPETPAMLNRMALADSGTTVSTVNLDERLRLAREAFKNCTRGAVPF